MNGSAAKTQGRPKGGPFSFVEPPDFLKSKTVKGRGIDLGTVEERAQEMIAALKEEYLDRVSRELALMEEAILAARRGSAKQRRAALVTLARLGHEIKGQAGTFGYDLITTIGSSLCDYIEQVKEPGPEHVTVLEIHADAMRVVVSDDIRGEGGETGRKLLAGIQAVVAKVRGR